MHNPVFPEDNYDISTPETHEAAGQLVSGVRWQQGNAEGLRK